MEEWPSKPSPDMSQKSQLTPTAHSTATSVSPSKSSTLQQRKDDHAQRKRNRIVVRVPIYQDLISLSYHVFNVGKEN